MKFIAFDLETTGTKPQEDMIVEIGAVVFEGGQGRHVAQKVEFREREQAAFQLHVFTGEVSQV